jgi:hypothetical protein
MGAETRWVVVYEVPVIEVDYYYGVTSEDAMQALKDNGPFGTKPLYAYLEDSPDVKFSWPWGD